MHVAVRDEVCAATRGQSWLREAGEAEEGQRDGQRPEKQGHGKDFILALKSKETAVLDTSIGSGTL